MTKNSPIKKALLASGLLLVSSGAAMAQEFHNTTERIGGTWASGMPNVTIAANADITVDGDWYLTANTITIDPAAKISGTGTIHLMTPATYGAAAAATTLNAGGNLGSGTGIGCKVSIENGNTVVLAGTNDLVMNNNLNFAKTNAHLLLGARNLVFTSGATALSQFQTTPVVGFNNQPADATSLQDAYVVTNGTGVVTKQGLANNTAFTYTVGQSAASGASTDYTPATVTNTAGAARNISTQVKTYANSASLESNTAYGIDRTWQITGSTPGTATVALTNNANSEGGSFVRNSAFVTQQVANGVWDVVAGGAPTTPNYTHTRTGLTVPTTGNLSYFSKSNDPTISISQNTQVDIVVDLQGPMQPGGIMTNTLQDYFGGGVGILPTTSPYGAPASTYTDINNTAGVAGLVTDWVKIDVLDGVNPVAGAPAQSRSLLLKPNGHVVDVDGSIPVFNGRAADARIVVNHRNHMSILSNELLANGNRFRGVYTYNFTTALSQASNAGGDPAQMVLKNGKWCMWAGDIFNDYFIDGNDRTQLNSHIGQNDETYLAYDINLDAFADGNDKTILNVNLQTAPNSTLVNY